MLSPVAFGSFVHVHVLAGPPVELVLLLGFVLVPFDPLESHFNGKELEQVAAFPQHVVVDRLGFGRVF